MDEHSREAVIAPPARAAPGSPQTPSCVPMRGARALYRRATKPGPAALAASRSSYGVLDYA